LWVGYGGAVAVPFCEKVVVTALQHYEFCGSCQVYILGIMLCFLFTLLQSKLFLRIPVV
jgi:hypothetical protein